MRFLFFFFFFSSLFADVIVMRHGEAQHNVDGTYNSNPNHSGYIPSHLTEVGKEQAFSAAKRLLAKGYGGKIEAVYVSPLPRTKETAAILAKSGLFDPSKIFIDERLIEVQIGDLEGKKKMSREKWSDKIAEKVHAESDASVSARVEAFYKERIQNTSFQNILIITHGIPASKLCRLISKKKCRLHTGEAVIFDVQSL